MLAALTQPKLCAEILTQRSFAMRFKTEVIGGKRHVVYSCPTCSCKLENELLIAGSADVCPRCNKHHTVPGADLARRIAISQIAAAQPQEIDKREALERRRAAAEADGPSRGSERSQSGVSQSSTQMAVVVALALVGGVGATLAIYPYLESSDTSNSPEIRKNGRNERVNSATAAAPQSSAEDQNSNLASSPSESPNTLRSESKNESLAVAPDSSLRPTQPKKVSYEQKIAADLQARIDWVKPRVSPLPDGKSLFYVAHDLQRTNSVKNPLKGTIDFVMMGYSNKTKLYDLRLIVYHTREEWIVASALLKDNLDRLMGRPHVWKNYQDGDFYRPDSAQFVADEAVSILLRAFK